VACPTAILPRGAPRSNACLDKRGGGPSPSCHHLLISELFITLQKQVTSKRISNYLLQRTFASNTNTSISNSKNIKLFITNTFVSKENIYYKHINK
jgi:hypothetical protein